MNKIANKPVVVILSNAITAIVEGNEALAVKLATQAITALSTQGSAKQTGGGGNKVSARRSSTRTNARRGPKPLLAPEQVAKMLARKIKGEKVAVLAQEAGVSYQTAYRSLNRLEEKEKQTAKKVVQKRRANSTKKGALVAA